MSHLSEAEPSDQQVPFVPPTPQEMERLLPHFTIHQLIAHGGMGVVYSGIQKGLDRPVAIKILPPDAGRDRESLARFGTEAKAMARLTHPHIPAVFDFAVVEEFCVLVMELVEGPNVFTLIRQGSLKPPQALEILAQVCDAVQFAHSRNIVHGDIKPGNILINQDGQVKLADFGLARLMEQGNRDSDTWTPMGTPEYAAPELYDKNATPDHRADIYSLGVVLFEMLTGAPPVGEFELPGEVLGLDPRVDDIIVRCMEFSPEARFQSAAEVRTLLRDIIEARNVPAARPSKAAPKRIFRAPRRNPAALRKQGPSPQKVAAAVPVRAAGAPPRREGRVASGNAPAARGRVKMVRLVEGGGRQASGQWPRSILAGVALLVIAVAAFLIFNRGTTQEPGTEQGSSSATQTGARPDRSSEVVPAPPETAIISTGTERRTSPVAPEPKPQPKPQPKPEPKSQSTGVTPTAAYAKIHELRVTYRDEWNARVESKLSGELNRLGNLYVKALQNLEDKYLGKGDAASVLAVRNEVQRFEKDREPAKGASVSGNPEIARLQQSLAAQVDKLRSALKYDADSVKENYLLAIKALEREMDEKADDAGSKAADSEFQTAAALMDSDLRNYFNKD